MIVATGIRRFKVTGDAADAEATNASRTNKSRSSRGYKILSTRARGRFQFQKRGQLFIRMGNDAFTVAVRQQRTSFAHWNSPLQRSPQLHPALLSLSAIASQCRFMHRISETNVGTSAWVSHRAVS
jgi:hypothetical protein